MLLKVAQEELVVLKDLIKEADTKYHDILDMGCMVPSSLFEWKEQLQQRQTYLNAVLENINNKDLLKKLNEEWDGDCPKCKVNCPPSNMYCCPKCGWDANV